MILNDAQKTSLAITLRELEARLARMRVLLEQHESIARLTPVVVRHLRASVDQQQTIIDELMRRFHLSRETIDVVQTMIAELSVSWSQLIDSRSNKLRRYGEVDPDLIAPLDPELDQLTELTMRMIHTLEQSRRT